jgi:hypothetical protein
MLGRRVTIEELALYLEQEKSRALAGHRVEELILHHTWKPEAAEYRGGATWEAIRAYHVQQRGFRDIGYHLGVAPGEADRAWLLRPLAMTGAHCRGHNSRSIGVVMVGNYDREDPELVLPTAVKVLAACARTFGLAPAQIYFHRDFADKSCPGWRVAREDVRQRVALCLGQPDLGPSAPPYEVGPVTVVLLPGGQLLDCDAHFDGQVTRCALRALAEGLGYEVHDHIPDQRKVYLRART